MAEKDTIDWDSPHPNTVSSLARELAGLGVRPGMILLAHSSLSALGWTAGGAQAAVLALERSVGPRGTLVMPAHTGHLSEPSRWANPPVPDAWWPEIRAELPAFDRSMTPCFNIGSIPECFRTQRGTVRSAHPSTSFAARGPKARFILRNRKLDFMLDEHSPIGRLYRTGAGVLLLGVGWDSNTCFHLGEYLADWPGKQVSRFWAPVNAGFPRRRVWREYRDIDIDSGDFPRIGAAFEKTGRVVIGTVGKAESRLFDLRDAVDFAAGWIAENRNRGMSTK